MPLDVWVTYITAVLLLMATPGPSQILILSNSLSNGFKKSLWTAFGDLTANLLQMILAVAGIAALIRTVENGLVLVKWAGVFYLVILGLSMIMRSSQLAISRKAKDRASAKSLWIQGFATSAANPKAIIFFAALFPQFIEPQDSFLQQFSILALTYLCLDAMFLSMYAKAAGVISRTVLGKKRATIDKTGGLLLLLAALGIVITR